MYYLRPVDLAISGNYHVLYKLRKASKKWLADKKVPWVHISFYVNLQVELVPHFFNFSIFGCSKVRECVRL